ncbi:MAG TPA: EutN/CcmL family microcompartment protein [Candidatus Copromorpha excrementigallinarum]|uniref:EutN/CcmL family microcompartment protein n=1 Tax=Candidatus Allocopromorpha excrementigallinarum TaxID=2840742 RepID=A0A9D1L6S5_9FIRM|nr:EutN/CcmL family microcompartment protein [Candidatus Copromorpha excrementigallinarum]
MFIGRVVGHIWATKKEESLSGMKLMVVCKTNDHGKDMGETFVAADVVGAGIGERVLVVNGSTARKAFNDDSIPIDAAIVGIIDTVEVDKSLAEKESKEL